jgi:competence protein ComEC
MAARITFPGAVVEWFRPALEAMGWCRRRLGPVWRREPLPPRPLVAVAAAVVVGAAASRAWGEVAGGRAALIAWATAAVVAGGWGWAWWRARPQFAGGLLLLGTAVASMAWGTARFDLFARDDLAWQVSAGPVPVAVRGTVAESPRQLERAGGGAAARGPVSEFAIRVNQSRIGSRWRAASGRATVIVAGEPMSLVSGTQVQILGRGLQPAAAGNPGEFDFADRARSLRSLSIIRADDWRSVRVRRRPGWWSLPAAVDRLRAWALATLARHVTPARLPLASALLLGSRESLPRSASDDFVATGTIHVLAISGLHVGLVAAGLFAMMRVLCLSARQASLAVAVATGLYMLLVGAETPVVRATLLVWVACGAVGVARRAATLNSLAVAAIVLVVWRPAEVFSAGAQLSFLSTAVLVGVARALPRRQSTDPIERLIERSRSRAERLLRAGGWWLGAVALSGAAVWLASAPLVAARFHILSPVGLVVNIVIAPLVPAAMTCGFLCLIVAPVSSWAAGCLAAACDATLAAIESAVGLAAAVPGGHVWVAGPPAWWVAGWYLLFAAAVVRLRRDLLARPTTWVRLAAVWAAIGLVGQVGGRHPADLRVIVASMGHGCGILVRSPLGRSLLYDAGRLGSPAAARRAMAAILWSEGVSRIDTLVISHADADHFNAVPELLDRFAVGRLLVPATLLESTATGVADLLAAATARGVPVETAAAGDSFAVDRLCRVRVHHPVPVDASGSAANRVADNESSLVLSVEAAGRRLLLTGDLEGRALREFLAGRLEGCDVLVAPHHGSHTSLPADLAAATRPRYVLASGREGRLWPQVKAAYAAAAGGSAEVLVTGGDGAMALRLAADRITLARFDRGRWRPASATGDKARPYRPSPRQPRQSPAPAEAVVSDQPAASSKSWLATYAPSSSKTPLVKP